jgi:uncharacterized protein YoxC
MEPTLGIILVVLVALVVGMLAPVLSQARRTLRLAEHRIDRIGARIEEVLDDTRRIVRRVDRVTEDLEETGVPAARLVESMADLASTLQAVRDRVGTVAAVASAVGPAVMAAVRAWRGEEPTELDMAGVAADGPQSDDDELPH